MVRVKRFEGIEVEVITIAFIENLTVAHSKPCRPKWFDLKPLQRSIGIKNKVPEPLLNSSSCVEL